jgi:hypothetical protein
MKQTGSAIRQRRQSIQVKPDNRVRIMLRIVAPDASHGAFVDIGMLAAALAAMAPAGGAAGREHGGGEARWLRRRFLDQPLGPPWRRAEHAVTERDAAFNARTRWAAAPPASRRATGPSRERRRSRRPRRDGRKIPAVAGEPDRRAGRRFARQRSHLFLSALTEHLGQPGGGDRIAQAGAIDEPAFRYKAGGELPGLGARPAASRPNFGRR